jgi:spore coat polysaccharide biosynthesis protein SpsF
MLNIGIVSQARLGSSRLPAKVLLSAGGKTLLEWHMERLAASRHPIILATTTRAEDDPLAEWAHEADLPVFRGSEDNVLSRYRECARHHNLDVIVRVTSDCPLIDGHLVARGIEHYLAFDETRQYVTNGQQRTFPRGFDFEIFSRELLEEAWQNATEPYEFEHVTPYFYQQRATGQKRMDIALRHFVQDHDHSDMRVTVDTVEDFELIRCLVEEFNAGYAGYQQITDTLLRHPQLVAINHHVEQKQVI